MSKRYKKQPPEKWENIGLNERHARLFIGMFESPAYRNLKSRQRDLYTHMKFQYKGKENRFTFSWSMANKVYGMYTNRNMFYSDVQALIDAGFIECVEYGKYENKKSVYAFSDKWKNTS